MNVPNLSRRLATRIIEGLQGRGRIVVVRGGTSALVRALDDAITVFIGPVSDRFEHELSPDVNQHTREILSLLAGTITQALFLSEHLEDVFADRSIVEREVFDAALHAFLDAFAAERARVLRVELDMLGYVAATAGRLAHEEYVTEALEHAAHSLGVKLSVYDPVSREAIFEPEDEVFPDLRLELEEAVADELCALVSQRVVNLPVLERTRPLVHHVSPAQKTRLHRTIERAADRTLRRTGCSAQWELPDDRSLRILFTPLSEQDARDVDAHVSEFATDVDTLLADAGAPLVTDILVTAPVARVASRHHDELMVAKVEVVAPEVLESEPVRVPARAGHPGVRAKAESRVVPKRVPATRATKAAEALGNEVPAVRKKPTAKLATATKKARVAKKR